MKARICMMAALALVAGAQLGTAHSAPHPQKKTHQLVLVSQDEALMAYDIDHHKMYTFMQGGEDHNSHWVNGPPCFIPGDGQGRFLEADDDPFETWVHNGKTENGDANAFFGLFTKTGVRDHSTDYGDDGRVGAEVPMQDPAGCAFDAHGNFFGVDVGFNHAPLMGDGQLVEFFAPDYTTWCVLDKSLSQPGMVAFDAQGGLLVPEAGFGQILRYSNFPADASHCSPGATRSIWMPSVAMGIGTPIGITPDPNGGWAVSSVLVLPAIYHVSVVAGHPVMDGLIAAPGPNTGTPFGLGYDKLGNLYWADLGVRPFPLDGTDPTDPIDSAPNQSGFAMVAAGGLPIATRIASGWQFADGVTVVRDNAITLPND